MASAHPKKYVKHSKSTNLVSLDDSFALKESSSIQSKLSSRASSDSDLSTVSVQRHSTLSVDTYTHTLGSGHTVTVSWDLLETVTSSDWIGLFFVGDFTSSNALDVKNRGLNTTRTGAIAWAIDNAQHHFLEGVSKVCFKYYHGPTGDLRAYSPAITVVNPNIDKVVGARSRHGDRSQMIHFTVSEICANYLKKGMFFNPDPYIKLCIQPGKRSRFPKLSHHGQEVKTTTQSSTTNPVWEHEMFSFEALPTDVLEFEVKDKFAKSRPTISRFLGKLTVPVQRLIDRTNHGVNTLTFNLMRRNPSDSVSGLLMFTVNIHQKGVRSPEHLCMGNHFSETPSSAEEPQSEVPAVLPGLSDQVIPNGYPDTETHYLYAAGEHEGISLDKLTRGRLGGSFEINEELLCHSPSSLSEVPVIECSIGEVQLPTDGILHDMCESSMPEAMTNNAAEIVASNGQQCSDLSENNATESENVNVMTEMVASNVPCNNATERNQTETEDMNTEVVAMVPFDTHSHSSDCRDNIATDGISNTDNSETNDSPPPLPPRKVSPKKSQTGRGSGRSDGYHRGGRDLRLQENYKVVKRKKDKRRDSGVQSGVKSGDYSGAAVIEVDRASSSTSAEMEESTVSSDQMSTSQELPFRVENMYANVSEIVKSTSHFVNKMHLDDSFCESPVLAENVEDVNIDTTEQVNEVDPQPETNVLTGHVGNNVNSPLLRGLQSITSSDTENVNESVSFENHEHVENSLGMNVDTGEADNNSQPGVDGQPDVNSQPDVNGQPDVNSQPDVNDQHDVIRQPDISDVTNVIVSENSSSTNHIEVTETTSDYQNTIATEDVGNKKVVTEASVDHNEVSGAQLSTTQHVLAGDVELNTAQHDPASEHVGAGDVHAGAGDAQLSITQQDRVSETTISTSDGFVDRLMTTADEIELLRTSLSSELNQVPSTKSNASVSSSSDTQSDISGMTSDCGRDSDTLDGAMQSRVSVPQLELDEVIGGRNRVIKSQDMIGVGRRRAGRSESMPTQTQTPHLGPVERSPFHAVMSQSQYASPTSQDFVPDGMSPVMSHSVHEASGELGSSGHGYVTDQPQGQSTPKSHYNRVGRLSSAANPRSRSFHTSGQQQAMVSSGRKAEDRHSRHSRNHIQQQLQRWREQQERRFTDTPPTPPPRDSSLQTGGPPVLPPPKEGCVQQEGRGESALQNGDGSAGNLGDSITRNFLREEVNQATSGGANIHEGASALTADLQPHGRADVHKAEGQSSGITAQGQPVASPNTSAESSTSTKERHFGISDELWRRTSNERNSGVVVLRDTQSSLVSVDESQRQRTADVSADTSGFGDRSSRLRRSNASLSGRRPCVTEFQHSRASLQEGQRSSPIEGEGDRESTSAGGSQSEIWERRHRNQRNSSSTAVGRCS